MHSNERTLHFLGFRPTGDLDGLTAYTNVRGKVVWFPKSPPKEPWSPLQILQRALFKQIAKAWQNLPEETRNEWNQACRTLRLHVSGYSLWVQFQSRRDASIIRTIERQSGRTLLP